jgi:hypothetical protein
MNWKLTTFVSGSFVTYNEIFNYTFNLDSNLFTLLVFSLSVWRLVVFSGPGVAMMCPFPFRVIHPIIPCSPIP